MTQTHAVAAEAHKAMNEVTKSTLRALRSKLDASGFLVVRGYLDEFDNVEDWYNGEDGDLGEGISFKDIGNDIKDLFDYVSGFVPTEDEVCNNSVSDDKKNKWTAIRQGTTSEQDIITLHSHLMCTKEFMNDFLEDFAAMPQPNNGAKYLRARVYMDVMEQMIVYMLRLDAKSFDSDESFDDVPKLRASDSGGRFIATMPKHDPQGSHCDFIHDYVSLTKSPHNETTTTSRLKYPAYFTMTVSKKTPLWIAEGSQRFVFFNEKEMKKVSELEKMKLVVIPENSLIIVRGETEHAAGGAKASNFEQCLRYHSYHGRDGIILPEAINDRGSELQKDPNALDRLPEAEDLVIL